MLDKDEIRDLLNIKYKEEGIIKKPTDDDVDSFFHKLDEDNNGKISFEEFQHFMIKQLADKILIPLKEYLISKGVELE